MRYSIKRVCWCEKTYNGFIDNPYWEITLNSMNYGLLDNGTLWSFNDSEINDNLKDLIRTIIIECKLNIIINT